MADDQNALLDPQAQQEYIRQMAARRAAIAIPSSVQGTPTLRGVQASPAAPQPTASPVAVPTMPSTGQALPAVVSPEQKQVTRAEEGLTKAQNITPATSKVMHAAQNIGNVQGTGQTPQELEKLGYSKEDIAQMTEGQGGAGGFLARHPTVGKIARLGGEVGAGVLRGVETAADIAAPRIMSQIPGTDLNKRVQVAQAQGQVSAAEKNQLEAAQAGAEKAKGVGQKDWAEVSGGAVDPTHPELGQQQAFYNKTDPTQRQYAGPMKPATASEPLKDPEIQNANAGFLDRYKVLNPTATALPQQYVLPKNATKEQRDFVDKQMEQVEKASGTKAQQDLLEKMRQDQATEHKREFETKQDEQLINYTDPKTHALLSGTRGEARAAGVKESDMKGPTNPALVDKARQAYTQYGRIIDNVQSAGNTMPAWNNEQDRQAAMKVSKMYWDHVSGNLVAAGAGVNPEYLQQAINSDAYRSMTPQGREHMQNMFQLWSDAINIVKQETGGVPRGQVFLQKEDAILPHPDKTYDMNEKALENLTKRIRTDAHEFARPSDVTPLGGFVPTTAQGELHDAGGRIVGYRDAKGKDVIF